MGNESTSSLEQAERVDHQLVRGIGIPALTANIVSSTIGAGIFVIPATVAKGLGSAAPLAFVCCAIAMVLFVTCFAIAGSRVSLTGGLYAYVEVAFGRYVGFLAGMLYFLTALGAVAGVVNVLANSVALVVPFLGGPVMRIIVMLAVYGSLVLINIRGVRQGAGAVTVITFAKLLPLLLFICVGIFFIHAPNLAWSGWPSSKSLGDAVILLIFAFVGIEVALIPSGEVKNPARTVPRSAYLALVITTTIYLMIQLVAQGTLGADLANHPAAPLAESAATFFQGKQVRFYTMGSPGGGYDTYMRALIPHLEKKLGVRMLPTNEPGAGGLIAVNRTVNAPPDGLTILLVGGETLVTAQLYDAPGVNYDVRKLAWLARVSSEAKVALLGPKSPYAGVADLVKSVTPVTWAGSSKIDGNTDFTAIMSHALGMKSKMIVGYKGTGDMNLAIQRGEVDGRVVSEESAALYGPSNGMRVVAVLARTRVEQFPDAPTLFESAKLAPAQAHLIDWRASIAGLGRLMVVTPGTHSPSSLSRCDAS